MIIECLAVVSPAPTGPITATPFARQIDTELAQDAPGGDNNKDMAVKVELYNTGDRGAGTEIVATIEHALSDRPGDWLVSILGSRENDNWEMKIDGPKGFQRIYTPIRSGVCSSSYYQQARDNRKTVATDRSTNEGTGSPSAQSEEGC